MPKRPDLLKPQLLKPQLLISVTSIEEAQIAIENGADIIDLKNPNKGALGALPIETVQSIVNYLRKFNPNQLISATIGDVPMLPELLVERVSQMAATKVDYIKIGFFDTTQVQICLDALKNLTKQGYKLIAVLFAEQPYSQSLVDAIWQAGFVGIMLDTAKKNGQTLLNYYTSHQLNTLAQHVQKYGLMLGFAGSLKSQHIVNFRTLNPTYMGFRGGVCEGEERTQKLNPEKVRLIKSLLLESAV
ncbi:MAG: (5-formylfuran-3-yl)methyl phosphate synthase [Methylophilaceae bacterium]